MVFKRRNKRSYLKIAQESFYPRGGWGRALSYIGYRLKRLPDPPHRIARGIASGVFVSFTPLFGFHFIAAAMVAFLIRGNLLAAMLSTFFGNPITFPIIAAISLGTADKLLGMDSQVPLSRIPQAFSSASAEIWRNVMSVFNDDVANWERLGTFFDGLFLPYMIGGLLPGAIAGTVVYFLSVPLIQAYQKRRAKNLRKKVQARLKAKAPLPTE